MIEHATGLGVWPQGGRATNGAKLVLGSKNLANQAYVFVWTAKRSIKHVISGMCINLQGTSLMLQKGCDTMKTMKFVKTGSGFKSIDNKYVMAGASITSRAGTALTASERVTAGSRFQFKSTYKRQQDFSYCIFPLCSTLQILFIFAGAATMKIQFSFTFGMGGEA